MRRWLVILALMPSLAWAASDSFPSAGALSANWTTTTFTAFATTPTITSPNSVSVAQWYGGGAVYTGTTFAADQSAQVTLVVNPSTSGNRIGVCVRMTAAGNGYCMFDGEIRRYATGTRTFLVGCGNPAQNQTYKLVATGTTLTGYVNGTQSCTIGDSTYSSGSPGFLVNNGNDATALLAVGSFVATGDVTDASPPSASPATATVIGSGSVSVSLSCASPSPTIRYTTDGATPTGASTVYSAPLAVTPPATVQAICQSSGMTDSAVMAATYWLSGGWTGKRAMTRH